MIRKTHTTKSAGPSFVLSDSSLDAMGDIVRHDGWKLDRFRANPICLFSHDSRFAIGTWANVRVEGKALRGELQLAPAGTSPRIDELRGLVKAGILRAVSVGFSAIEHRAMADGSGGIEFLRQELLECSLCAIPANSNALMQARALGVTEATQRIVFAQPMTADEQCRQEFRARLQAMTPEQREECAREVYARGRATVARIDAAWESEQRRRRLELELELAEPLDPSAEAVRFADAVNAWLDGRGPKP